MPSLSSIKTIKKKINKVYGNGKLEKAYFVLYEKQGNKYKAMKDKKVQVQFNPAEYSVQRMVRQSSKKPFLRDNSSKEIQTVHAELSTLSISLYFDSYTELKSEQGIVNYATNTAADYLKGKYNAAAADTILPSFDMNEDLSPNPDYNVNQRFDEFLKLIKYAPQEHEPPHVGFIWGDSICFIGKLVSQNTQYTVFDRDGTPVRARISMTIVGEDVKFDNKAAPFESPDRTKQRTLRYGDQLWMMAQEEYGDVAHWKTIAEANRILNPRTIGNVVRLKVPSIR